MNVGYYFELRKAWYNTITAITYNGSPVQAFDSYATDDVSRPYVIIDTMTSNDNRNKCDSAEDCAVTLDINASYSQGGRKAVDEIASLIIASKSQMRNAMATITSAVALIDVYKITDGTLTGQSATEKVYRRVITFGHILTT